MDAGSAAIEQNTDRATIGAAAIAEEYRCLSRRAHALSIVASNRESAPSWRSRGPARGRQLHCRRNARRRRERARAARRLDVATLVEIRQIEPQSDEHRSRSSSRASSACASSNGSQQKPYALASYEPLFEPGAVRNRAQAQALIKQARNSLREVRAPQPALPAGRDRADPGVACDRAAWPTRWPGWSSRIRPAAGTAGDDRPAGAAREVSASRSATRSRCSSWRIKIRQRVRQQVDKNQREYYLQGATARHPRGAGQRPGQRGARAARRRSRRRACPTNPSSR